MGLFDDIGKVQAAGGSRYLTPGNYTCEVQALKVIESQKRRGQQFFVAELAVVDCDNGEFGPGECASWVVNMDHQSALSNIKGFAMALDTDSSDSSITPQVMEELVSGDNPAAGIKVRGFLYNVKTKAGKDFTKANWSAFA
jgi:hypothetical protein